MGRLTYTALTSLDGYMEDEQGDFGWAEPDAEVHAFVNDLMRPVGTELYGRRMYETMAVWETIGDEPGVSAIEVDFAEQWRATDKVVFSRTLDEVRTPRTTLERELTPEVLRHLKETSDRDLSISGIDVATHAFRAGLVDEVHLFLFPVIVGGGKNALPSDVHLDLELVAQRSFTSGVVHLQHRLRR
jgi:dihydrofolate reductase